MAGGGFTNPSHGGGGTSAKVRQYPGKATSFVIISCIMAASGGLIFGYDIGISGTLNPNPNPKTLTLKTLTLTLKP